jgi:hypothetical protein
MQPKSVDADAFVLSDVNIGNKIAAGLRHEVLQTTAISFFTLLSKYT